MKGIAKMKKYFSVIFLLELLCFLMIGCQHEKDFLIEKELSDLTTNDVTSFQVTLNPPNKKITITDDDNISTLITILNKVTIYEQDDSYKDGYGQWVEFELELTDGSAKTVVAYNPFIIIDGIGYKTEYEPCEELNVFGNSLIE